MSKIPSPCIDICKYKRKGHCIACSMTKDQKSMMKALKKPKHQITFIEMLVAQQNHLGQFSHWADAYEKKCHKKKVPNPLVKV